MAENHLLIKVVNTTRVVSDIGVYWIVLNRYKVLIGILLCLSGKNCLEYGVRYL